MLKSGPRILGLGVLLLAAAGARCGNPHPPNPTDLLYTVRMDGTEIRVKPLETYAERRHALQQYGGFSAETGLLLLYRRKRYHHFHSDRDRTYTLAYLDPEGVVREIQRLEPGEKGVTSRGEYPSVLILDAAYAGRLPLKTGTRVAFSARLRKLKPEPLPVIRIGNTPIRVEISARHEERRRGLMYRKRMSPDEGMLFVYAWEKNLSFWMGNTFLKLSIAFIREDGTIATIHHDMLPYEDPENPPGDYQQWPSRVPVKYALEVNHGFFKEHGIVEGMKVRFPEILQGMSPDP